MSLFSKSASILGSFLVATFTSTTGNPSFDVLSIGTLLAFILVLLAIRRGPVIVT